MTHTRGARTSAPLAPSSHTAPRFHRARPTLAPTWLLLLAAILLAPALPPAHAQPATAATPQVGVSQDDIAFANRLSSAFRSVARTVEPSVVHITSLSRQVFQRSLFDPGQVRIAPNGLGSGVVISADGYIVTNNHVVQDAEQLQVKLWDGTSWEATIVGRDPATDLAVIRITPGQRGDTGSGPDLRPAAWGNSEALQVGDWVVAIGSPFGLSNTVTAGIVSAKGRQRVLPTGMDPRARTYEDFIQTDAAINPGNSGGPMVDLQGQIVGINSAIATRSGGYDGIGFSIPAAMARPVVESIIANGRVVRGWLGVVFGEASPAGVPIERVVPGGPAERAGLREGDIVARFDGRPVDTQRLMNAIAIAPPGSRATLAISRDGRVEEVAVTLGDQASGSATARGLTFIRRLDIAVLRVGALSRSDRRRLLPADQVDSVRGVVVAEVDDVRGPMGRELQVGDIITAVGREEVEDEEGFRRLIESADFSQGVRLRVIRGGERGWIDLRQ